MDPWIRVCKPLQSARPRWAADGHTGTINGARLLASQWICHPRAERLALTASPCNVREGGASLQAGEPDTAGVGADGGGQPMGRAEAAQ